MGIKDNSYAKSMFEFANSRFASGKDVKEGFARFLNKLATGSVSIDPEDIKICPDGGITVCNVRCCAYIKEQRGKIDYVNKESTYRYHLVDCKTMQDMRDGGREQRYVATTLVSEWFPVIPQTGARNEKPEEIILHHKLCKNCIALMREKGIYFEPFSLKEYFARHNSEISSAIEPEQSRQAHGQYAANHEKVAQIKKQEAGYKCQNCGVDCSAHQLCLHLHHIDGNGQNNEDSNLKVLCALCHSKQYKHRPMNDSCIEIIQKLRQEQSIFLQ